MNHPEAAMARTRTHDVWEAMNHMASMPEEVPYATPRDEFEAVKAKEKKPRGSRTGEKETVDVPDRRVGALIGKKGSNLRELEERTGATVTVPKEPRNRGAPKELQVRTVAVTGAPRDPRLRGGGGRRRAGPRAKRGQTTTTMEIW